MHTKYFIPSTTIAWNRKEETIDYHIKTAWHAIARMYNQRALKYGGTMSIGFALLNIDADEGTPATKIAPLMGLEGQEPDTVASLDGRKNLSCRESETDKRSVRIKLTEEGKNNGAPPESYRVTI